MLLGLLDWGNVIGGLIAALPAIIAAFAALRIKAQIKTPSGDSIGIQVEKAHHTGIANNSLLGLVVHKDESAPDAVVSSEGLLVAPTEPETGKA